MPTINSPTSDPIFTYGSNVAGRHGKGAALFAARWRGAKSGQGEGLAGSSYAIPTKDRDLVVLPLHEIYEGIARFLDVVKSMPDVPFQVTRIGCGLAGYADAEIALAFEHAPANCLLPYCWERMLGRARAVRVIIAGSRSFTDKAMLKHKMDALLAHVGDPIEFVSGTAPGADRIGELYAEARNHVPPHRFPADWDRYGKREAGGIRNQYMSWFSSHLVDFWDGHSPGSRNMIDTAKADGLNVRVIRF